MLHALSNTDALLGLLKAFAVPVLAALLSLAFVYRQRAVTAVVIWFGHVREDWRLARVARAGACGRCGSFTH